MYAKNLEGISITVRLLKEEKEIIGDLQVTLCYQKHRHKMENKAQRHSATIAANASLFPNKRNPTQIGIKFQAKSKLEDCVISVRLKSSSCLIVFPVLAESNGSLAPCGDPY